MSESTPQLLRIAVLGWAGLALQEREGTGYNLHASELAAGLAAAGHEVSYLRSGMDYSMRPGMYIRRRAPWRGVQNYDLVNSPNLSVGFFNFRNVREQISSPAHTRLVVRWVKERRADVVHIHSLEGYGFDLIPALRAEGIPVVVTPHNYYALCPQVDLLHREVNVCDDYDGGRRCEGCLAAPDYRAERRHRTWYQSTPGSISRGLSLAWNKGKALVVRKLGATEEASAPPPPPLPTRPSTPPDINSRLLEATHHLKVLNNYGDRRVAGVAAMNSATLVLCPSRFLMGVHAAMGVDPAVMRHVPLGQPHFDAIAAAAEQSAYYRRQPWNPAKDTRPLRFAFFGSTRYNKGLDVLVRAIALLTLDTRSRCHFHIRAGGDTRPHREFLRGVPEACFYGGYTPAELPTTLGAFDVGIVPTTGLENSPFVILEHLHAGKFVIGSRLGGPTDFINEPRNGMLVPAGSPQALAEAITLLVRGQVRVPSPAEVREASRLRTFEEYLAEVVGVYREVIDPQREKRGRERELV
jgi:glycosyltransferase involved in cell wall biosynthesis